MWSQYQNHEMLQPFVNVNFLAGEALLPHLPSILPLVHIAGHCDIAVATDWLNLVFARLPAKLEYIPAVHYIFTMGPITYVIFIAVAPAFVVPYSARGMRTALVRYTRAIAVDT